MGKIGIIGSGFSGLSAAAYAAKDGYEVHVFEKNDSPGGRARQFKTEKGYTFDMGPSWYWMPDIIHQFFEDHGYSYDQFYDLVSLNPQFEMIFENAKMIVPKDYDELKVLFESLEDGAGERLDKFMRSAKYKYDIGMKEFVNKPCHSWFEFASPKIGLSALRLDLLSNFRSYVARYFKHPQLIALMEFPVIFLGASPKDIPALYSLMNYGGYYLGTWYPMGGFSKVVEGMVKVCENLGVKFHYNAPVDEIICKQKKVQSIRIGQNILPFDAVIATSDYAHTETLLPESLRNYKTAYWDKKTFAPSCLIYFLGIKEKIPNLKHHTLFFEHDLNLHISDIYDRPSWPDSPLFYACCPSKTDTSLAPEGHENLFLLLPLAIGLQDSEETREVYFQQMIKRIEAHTGQENLFSKIDYKRSYCVSDFINDYNAFKGNAYGLANTLNQTAVLKPTIRNHKITNLLYAGQLTVPGPGVPPSIISGRIVAQELTKLMKKL